MVPSLPRRAREHAAPAEQHRQEDQHARRRRRRRRASPRAADSPNRPGTGRAGRACAAGRRPSHRRRNRAGRWSAAGCRRHSAPASCSQPPVTSACQASRPQRRRRHACGPASPRGVRTVRRASDRPVPSGRQSGSGAAIGGRGRRPAAVSVASWPLPKIEASVLRRGSSRVRAVIDGIARASRSRPTTSSRCSRAALSISSAVKPPRLIEHGRRREVARDDEDGVGGARGIERLAPPRRSWNRASASISAALPCSTRSPTGCRHRPAPACSRASPPCV